MGRVASVGCIACRRLGYGETPAQLHHIREGRIARNAFLTIPLCAPHHTGTGHDGSVHMDKSTLMGRLGVSSEFDLLADVLELIAQ
jgi:hypothetical protein